MTTFNRYLDTIYMVADGVNVGKAIIQDDNQPCIYIILVKIVKPYRRKGYGATFINHITKLYSSYESISLYVSVYNNAAIGLYRKCGFFISLFKDGVYPHYLMTKKL